MDILIQVAQFILSLSILIVLHELGHFIPAKLFKTRVEKFYLFFDPWFSVFKFKKGETEYGIGWLPLGGYVKIAGMIDESMDKEQMKQPAQPWEFRSKPAWQRLIIMVGGVTVNVILGVFILWMMLFAYGQDSMPATNLKYGVVVADTSIKQLGFKDGDKILGIVGNDADELNEINRELLLDNGNSTVIVERNGQKLNITIPKGFTTDSLLGKEKSAYFYEAFPADVDSVIPDYAGVDMGIKKGDRIIDINGRPINYFVQIREVMKQYKNKDVVVTVLRNSTDTVVLKKHKMTEETALGVFPASLDKYFTIDHTDYSFFGALPAAMHRGGAILTNYGRQFKILFTKQGAKQIGGFASIASQYSRTWDWERFWSFTAVLSFILAFMNILPIPALDGGHVMFLLYEIITRRKPSEKAMEIAQYIGLILVLGLLLFANGNDIYKHFIK